MQKTITISGWVWVFLMLAPFITCAQEIPAATDSITEAEVLPIPVSEIIIQAASLQIQVEDAFEQVITEDEITLLGEQVDTLSEKVKNELQEPSLPAIPSLSLRALRIEKRVIAALDDRVTQLQESLVEEVHTFDEKKTEITALKNLWQITYENAKALSAPPLIISRAHTILHQLDSLEQQLLTKENTIIQMLDVITKQHLQVTRHVDAVNEQLTGGGGNLYLRKYPSMFQIPKIRAADISLTDYWQDFLDSNQEYFREYVNEHRYRFIFHIILTLALYALLVFPGHCGGRYSFNQPDCHIRSLQCRHWLWFTKYFQ